MKNLKRIFSLALAGTMLAGMLTVGASAANFTDAEDIKNDDAVNFMVALNIINGKDDGSFDPEATVTRAEMAKMITIALNGGKEPVLGTLATPTYTDIKGNWAEKYIEYCSNLGIIGGRGNGTFDPSGTVTGTEAAKMMLVAMGYDSTVFNFTGADWAINVNTEANNTTPNKLYKGIESIDPNAGLSRDNAAQLIFNGVQDHIMEKSPSLTITNGEIQYNYNKMDGTWGNGIEKTILTEKYGYRVEYGYMVDADYDNDGEIYEYDIDATEVAEIGATAISKNFFTNGSTAANPSATSGTVTFNEDVSDLFGQRVKVVYNAEDLEAVGIYAADSNVLASGIVNDLPSPTATATSAKLGGTTYRFDGDPTSANDNTANGVHIVAHLDPAMTSVGTLGTKGSTIKAEWTYKAIDNDGDGRVNVIVVTPYVLSKVTYKGSETITLSPAVGGATSFDLEDDINVYEDVKRNDYVVAIPAANCVDGKALIVKAETVEGTIGAVKTGSDKSVRIDGTWYDVADVTIGDDLGLSDNNKDVTLYLVNGLYAFADLEDATSNDLVVLTKIATTRSFDGTYEAKGAFTVDSTVRTVKVQLDGTPATAPTAGVFYTYEVDDGVYILKAATTGNGGTTNYDKTVTGAAWDTTSSNANKQLSGAFVADDAVVIVAYKNETSSKADPNKVNDKDTGLANTDFATLEKVEFVTGAAAKKWASGTYSHANVTKAFADTSNGLDYIQVMFLAFDRQDLPGATGDTRYGYIVTNSYRETEGTTNWTYFDIWNGSEVVSVKEKGAHYYTSRTAIAYTEGGNDEITVKTAVAEDTADATKVTRAAVKGYNAGDEVISITRGFDNVTRNYKIDKETVVVYIDSENNKGVQSEGIELATQLGNGAYEQNAIVILADDAANGHVDGIFVDINNKIRKAPVVASAAPNATLATSGTTTLADLKAMDPGVYATTGSTVGAGFNTTCTDATEMLYFVFDAPEAADYTLTVKTAAGATAHTEHGSVGAGDAVFYVWYKGAPSVNGWQGAANGSYTYTITYTSGSNTVTVGEGSFLVSGI